jgi:hypothetical protein
LLSSVFSVFQFQELAQVNLIKLLQLIKRISRIKLIQRINLPQMMPTIRQVALRVSAISMARFRFSPVERAIGAAQLATVP